MGGGERMDLQELPVGFSMALAQRPGALERFGNLDQTEKQMMVSRAYAVDSEQEMRALVERMMM